MLAKNPIYSFHYFARNLIKKGDVVIDIGANLGYYSVLFAKWVGPEGKVYAVEPIELYNKVFNKEAKKYNNITLFPYALGTEKKKVFLVSSPHTGYLNTGLPHVYDPKDDGNIQSQEYRFECDMEIPAELFSFLERLDYIKCDIEGFEYIVLNNLKEIIERFKPKVQVEVWGKNQQNILDLFAGMGYNTYHVADGKLKLLTNFNEKVSTDCVFIHKDDTIF